MAPLRNGALSLPRLSRLLAGLTRAEVPASGLGAMKRRNVILRVIAPSVNSLTRFWQSHREACFRYERVQYLSEKALAFSRRPTDKAFAAGWAIQEGVSLGRASWRCLQLIYHHLKAVFDQRATLIPIGRADCGERPSIVHGGQANGGGIPNAWSRGFQTLKQNVQATAMSS